MALMVLRLFEDHLPAAVDSVYLPARNRALYLAKGEVTVEFASGCARQEQGSAWVGGGEIALMAGQAGACVLRWELAPTNTEDAGLLRAAPCCTSMVKLAEDIDLGDGFGWLMRCDEVAFPKGGIAYTHVHQGPGIRICLEGRIRIETDGASSEYGPGQAWFESGATPVLAPTSEHAETRFVRCFVLPRGCKGKSSIRYVLPEDAAKPKTQRYKVLAEQFIKVA